MNIKHLALSVLLFCAVTIPAAAQDKIIREDIEWMDVWIPHTNDKGLPRILIIGNSIVRGYYPEVAKLLEGKAYVARLSTSKSVGDPALNQEITLILSYHKFDIIQFNNGLHGFDYTEADYKKAFPSLVKTIQKAAPNARLVWASTTPVRNNPDTKTFNSRNDRVKERNRIALEYLSTQKGITITDLYSEVADREDFYKGGDGVHPVQAGVTAMAQKVAAQLAALLVK